MIKKINTFQSNGKSYNSCSNLHIDTIFYRSGKPIFQMCYSYLTIFLKDEVKSLKKWYSFES